MLRVSVARASRSVCLRTKNTELSGNSDFLGPVWRLSTWNHRAFSVGYDRIPCSTGTGNLIQRIREKNSAEQGKNWEEQGSARFRLGDLASRVFSPLKVLLEEFRRQAIRNSRAWSLQSIGMPSRRSCATESSTGCRPSRIAAWIFGARKASGMRVRM